MPAPHLAGRPGCPWLPGIFLDFEMGVNQLPQPFKVRPVDRPFGNRTKGAPRSRIIRQIRLSVSNAPLKSAQARCVSAFPWRVISPLPATVFWVGALNCSFSHSTGRISSSVIQPPGGDSGRLFAMPQLAPLSLPRDSRCTNVGR